ncbi:hypothetical protein ABPG73_003964 [Tetrahymena malaccensis]
MQKSSNTSIFWVWNDQFIMSISIQTFRIVDMYKLNQDDFTFPKELIIIEDSSDSLNVILLNQQQTLVCTVNLKAQNYNNCAKNDLQIWPDIPYSQNSKYFSIIYINQFLVYDSSNLINQYTKELISPNYLIRFQEFNDQNIQFGAVDENHISFFFATDQTNSNQNSCYFETYSQNQSLEMGKSIILETKNLILNINQNFTLYQYSLNKTSLNASLIIQQQLPCQVTYNGKDYICQQLISYDYYVIKNQILQIAIVFDQNEYSQLYLQIMIELNLNTNQMIYLYSDIDIQNQIRFLSKDLFLVFSESQIQIKKSLNDGGKRLLEQKKQSRVLQFSNLFTNQVAQNNNSFNQILQKDNNQILTFQRQIISNINDSIDLEELSKGKSMLTDEKQIVISVGKNLFYFYDSILGNLIYIYNFDGNAVDFLVVGQSLLILSTNQILSYKILKYSIQLISSYDLSFSPTSFSSIISIQNSIYLSNQEQVMLIDLVFLQMVQQSKIIYSSLSIQSEVILVQFQKIYLTQLTNGQVFVILDQNLQILNKFDFTQYSLLFSSDKGQAILVQQGKNSTIYDSNLQNTLCQNFTLLYQPILLLYDQKQIVVMQNKNSYFLNMERFYYNKILQKLIIKQKNNKMNQISSVNLNSGQVEQIMSLDNQEQVIILNDMQTNTLYSITSTGLNKISLFVEKYDFFQITFDDNQEPFCQFYMDNNSMYLMAYFCIIDDFYFIQIINILNKSVQLSYGEPVTTFLNLSITPMININAIAVLNYIGFKIVDLNQQTSIFDLNFQTKNQTYSNFNFFNYLEVSKKIIFSYDNKMEVHQFNNSGFYKVCSFSCEVNQTLTDLLKIGQQEEIVYLLSLSSYIQSFIPQIQIFYLFNLTSCALKSSGQLFKSDIPFQFYQDQQLESLNQTVIFYNPYQILTVNFIGNGLEQSTYLYTSIYITKNIFYLLYNEILEAYTRLSQTFSDQYLVLNVHSVPLYVMESDEKIYIISSSMIEIYDTVLKKGLIQIKSSFQIQNVFTLADQTSIILISPFIDLAIFDIKTQGFIQQLRFSTIQQIPTLIKYYSPLNLLVLTCQNIMFQIDLNQIFDFQKSVQLQNFYTIIAEQPQQIYQQTNNIQYASIYLFDTQQILWLYNQLNTFQIIATFYGQNLVQYLINGQQNSILLGFKSYFALIYNNTQQTIQRNDQLTGIDILCQKRYFVLQELRKNIYELIANPTTFQTYLYYSIDQNDDSTISYFLVFSDYLTIVYTNHNQLMANKTLIHDFSSYFQQNSSLQFVDLILADGNQNCFAVSFNYFFIIYYYNTQVKDQIISFTFYQIYSSTYNVDNGFIVDKLLMFQNTIYFTISYNRVCIALSLPLQILIDQKILDPKINYSIQVQHQDYLDFTNNFNQKTQTFLLVAPCSDKQKKIFVNNYVSILFCKYSMNVYLKKNNKFVFSQVYQMFGLIEIFNIQNTNLFILRSSQEIHVLLYSIADQTLIQQKIIEQQTDKIIEIYLIDGIQQGNSKNQIQPNSVVNVQAILSYQVISFQIVLSLYYDQQSSQLNTINNTINTLTCYQNYDIGMKTDNVSNLIQETFDNLDQIGQFFKVSSIFFKLPIVGQQQVKKEKLDQIINQTLQFNNFTNEFTFYSLQLNDTQPQSLQRFFNYNITSLKMKNIPIYLSNKSDIRPAFIIDSLIMDQIYITNIQNFSRVKMSSLNTLIITGMTIENMKFFTNQLFLFQNITTVFLQNIVIRNISGFAESLFTIKNTGNIIIDGLYIADIEHLDFESIFNINNSKGLQINNVTIRNVLQTAFQSIIFNTSLINEQTITTLVAENLFNLTIHLSINYDEIDDMLSILQQDVISYFQISIINCTQNNALFSITSNKCSFYYCQVSDIFSYNSLGSFLLFQVGSISIIQSNFTNNTATEGGSIYLLNSRVDSVISDSNFSDCVSQGRGGAVFLENTFIKIQDSNFHSCSSLIGGSIFYTDYRPQIIYQNQILTSYPYKGFSNNSAEIYGQNIGSYPEDFYIQDGQSEENSKIVQQNNSYFLGNLRSGEVISFQVKIVDEENNPITIRSDYLTAYPSFINQVLQEFSIKIQIANLVNDIEISDQTYADISNYILQNKTWSFTNLKVTSSADYQGSQKLGLIQLICFGVRKVDRLGKFINQDYSKNLTLSFRQCKKGEVLNARNGISECIPCPNGFFSMDQPVASQFIECKPCPQQAYECEKDQIYLKQGYWRNNNSLNIYFCYNRPENCEGSLQGNKNYCSEGFVGALCESCDSYGTVWGQKYMKTGLFNCVPCVNAQSYYFIFPIIVLLILIVFYVVFSINNAIKISKQLSQAYYFKKIGVFNLGRSSFRVLSPFLAKQLMHFLQISGLINSYKLALPYFFVVLMNVISQPITNFQYVLDCFFVPNQQPQSQNNGDSSVPQITHTPIPLVFMRAIWNLCIPFIILILVSIVYSILFCIKAVQYKHFYAYNGVFFLMIFLQPNIVSSLISIVSCKNIDGISYIKSDSNYQCYTQEHIKYCLLILLPTLILWVFIIPLFILSRLIIQRNNLECISTRLKFGFLYQEFKSKYFYWEFVKSYKKILLVIIYNFGQDFFYLKSCLMLLVLFIYYLNILNRNPYQLNSFNKTDKNLIICMLFILVMNIILQDTNVYWIAMTGEFFTALFTIFIIGFLIIQIIYQKIYSIIPYKIYSLQMFLKGKLPYILFWIKPKKPLNGIRAFKNWKKVKNILLTKGLFKQNEKQTIQNQKDSTSLANQNNLKNNNSQQQNHQIQVTNQIQSIQIFSPQDNSSKQIKNSNKPIQLESSSSQELSNSDISCSEQNKNEQQSSSKQSNKEKQKKYSNIKQITNNIFNSDYQDIIQNHSNSIHINDINSQNQLHSGSCNLLSTSNFNHQKGLQMLSGSAEKWQFKKMMNGESIDSSQIEMCKLLHIYPSILNHRQDIVESSQISNTHFEQNNSPSLINSNTDLNVNSKINQRSQFQKNLDQVKQEQIKQQNIQFKNEDNNQQIILEESSNQDKISNKHDNNHLIIFDENE